MLTALSWLFASAPWSSARKSVVVTLPVALATSMVNTRSSPVAVRPCTTPLTSESTTAWPLAVSVRPVGPAVSTSE
ncbi:hypothetical protein D9M68_843210 [compost metagenome]